MPPPDNSVLTHEAKIFTRYLIGEEANARAIGLYISANQTLDVKLNAKEQKRLNYLLKHPGSIGMVDGALAFINPKSAVRMKIYVMFAVLESCPEYHHHFLPKPGSELAFVMITGAGAISEAMLGLFILPWI